MQKQTGELAFIAAIGISDAWHRQRNRHEPCEFGSRINTPDFFLRKHAQSIRSGTIATNCPTCTGSVSNVSFRLTICNPIPVSYTHLDVYKRQGYDRRDWPLRKTDRFQPPDHEPSRRLHDACLLYTSSQKWSNQGWDWNRHKQPSRQSNNDNPRHPDSQLVSNRALRYK